MTNKPYHLIVGLGQTGLSCAKYLLKKGYAIAVTDSRDNPPGLEALMQFAPETPVECGALSASLIQGAECLVMSPGVSLQEPLIAAAVQSGKPFLGDIELFAKKVNVPVVGITGSNGKSTVTTLVGEMAKKAGRNVVVAGNIGTPILDVYEQNPDADLYVLELSSFQLETTHTLKLAAATILNITEDHMDRYPNMQAYTAAKQRIYLHANSAIYNRDDGYTLPNNRVNQSLSFGMAHPLHEKEYGLLSAGNKRYLVRGQEKLTEEQELFLRGGHNLLNAQAALALGEAVGLPLNDMLAALRDFKGLKHRCELVAEHDGVSWYNDSKATNVGATVAAIKTLVGVSKRNIILIAGGVGKGADFSALKPIFDKCVKRVILIGEAAEEIRGFCTDTPATKADSMAQAIQFADREAKQGDVVLLAPACASFDMFNNYAHRGDVFRQTVQEFLNGKHA